MRFARSLTLASAPDRPQTQRFAPALASARRGAPFIFALAILIAAALVQARLGAIGDVSWMITISEKWLDGATPYVDFVETNPPAAILVYLPPVALARAFGAHPEFIVAAWGFAVCGACLALAAAILSQARLLGELGLASLGAALIALTLLPGRAFDERDFFVALLALPPLAAVAARASGARIGLGPALVAGLGMAAVVAVKPPYGLIFAAPAVFLVARQGWRSVLGAGEYWIAAVALAIVAGLVAWRFPTYGREIVPAVIAAYLPVRETFLSLLANVAVVGWAALATALALVAGRSLSRPLIVVPALAAAGALAVYFIQGKGWLYQAYPALALLALALGAALDLRGAPPGGRAFAAATALATALAAAVAPVSPFVCAVLVALIAAGVFLVAGGARLAAATREWRLAELAAAAMTGALWVLYCAPPTAPDADFVRAVAALSPHPRLAAIAEGLGIGFPLVRRVDGVWVQRTQGLLFASAARRLIDEHPSDAALARRLQPIIDRDAEMAAEDIVHNRPDGVLVNTFNPRFHEWAMHEPAIAAALADYTLATSSRAADWPIDLYVRKDSLGLRRDVSEPPAPAR
jgi:hypothetical protein